MIDQRCSSEAIIISSETSAEQTLAQLYERGGRKTLIQGAIALGQIARFGKHKNVGITLECTQQRAQQILQEMDMETASDFSLNEFALLSCFGSKNLDSVVKFLNSKSRTIQAQAIQMIPQMFRYETEEKSSLETQIAKYLEIIKICPPKLRIDLIKCLGKEDGKGKNKSIHKESSGLSIVQRAIDQYIQSLSADDLVSNVSLFLFASESLLESQLAESFIEHAQIKHWISLVKCHWSTAIFFLNFWADKMIEQNKKNKMKQLNVDQGQGQDEDDYEIERYFVRSTVRKGNKKKRLLNLIQVIIKIKSPLLLIKTLSQIFPIILQSSPQDQIKEQKQDKKNSKNENNKHSETVISVVKKVLKATQWTNTISFQYISAYPSELADYFIYLVQSSRDKIKHEREKQKEKEKMMKNAKENEKDQKQIESKSKVQEQEQEYDDDHLEEGQYLYASFNDVANKLNVNQITTMLKLQRDKEYKYGITVSFLELDGSWIKKLTSEKKSIILKEIIQQKRDKRGLLDQSVISIFDFKERSEEAQKWINQIISDYEKQQKKKLIKKEDDEEDDEQEKQKEEKEEIKEVKQSLIPTTSEPPVVKEIINNELEQKKLPFAVYLPWHDFYSIAKHLINNNDINIRSNVVQHLIQYIQINESYISLCKVMNIMLQKKKEQNQFRIQYLNSINQLSKRIFIEKKNRNKDKYKQKEKDSEQQNKESEIIQIKDNQQTNKVYRSFIDMMSEYIRQALDDSSTDSDCLNSILTFIIKMLPLNPKWGIDELNLIIDERGVENLTQGLFQNKKKIDILPNALKKELYQIFKPTLMQLFIEHSEFGQFETFKQWQVLLSIFVGVSDIKDELIIKLNETLEKAKQARVAYLSMKLLRQNDKQEKKKSKKQTHKKEQQQQQQQTQSSIENKNIPFTYHFPSLIQKNWGLVSLPDVMTFLIKRKNDILTPLFQLGSPEQKQLIEWTKKAGDYLVEINEGNLKKTKFRRRGVARLKNRNKSQWKKDQEKNMLLEGTGAGLIQLPFKFVQGSKAQQLLYAKSLMQIIGTSENEVKEDDDEEEEEVEKKVESQQSKDYKEPSKSVKQITMLQLAAYVKRFIRLPAVPAQFIIKLALEDKRAIVYKAALQSLTRIDTQEGLPTITHCLLNDDNKCRICIRSVKLMISEMAPIDALQFIHQIPSKRVTVVKEKVRLIMSIKNNDQAVINELFAIVRTQDEVKNENIMTEKDKENQEEQKINSIKDNKQPQQKKWIVHRDSWIAVVDALCKRFAQLSETWDFLESQANSDVEEIALSCLPDRKILNSFMDKRIFNSIDELHEFKEKQKNQWKQQNKDKEKDKNISDNSLEGETISDRVKKILIIHFSHPNPKVQSRALEAFRSIPLEKFGISVKCKEDHQSLTQFILTLIDHNNHEVVTQTLNKLRNEMEKINLEEECRKPLLQKIVDVANKKTRNKELIKIQTDCASVLPFFLRIPDISDPNDSIQPNDTNLLQQIIHQWINIPGLDLLNSFLETISDNVPQIYIQRQIQVEIKKDSIQQQFKLLYEAVTPLLEEKPYTVEDQIDLIIKRLNVDDVLKVLESLAAKKRLNKENALHFYDQFKRHTYQLMKHLSRNMKEEEFGCGVTSLEKELLSSQNANIRRIGFELLTDDVSNLTEKEVKEKEENGEEEEEDDDNLFDSQQEEDDNQSQDEEKDQNDGSEIISKKQEKNKKRKYYRFWGAERRELLKKCQEDTSIFVQEPAMHFSFSADDN